MTPAGMTKGMRPLFLFLLAFTGGCAAEKAATDPVRFHADALSATAAKPLNDAAREAAMERFRGFFGDLKEESIRSKIREVYAEDVWFNDTLKSIRGVEELESYLVEAARNVASCKVEFDEVVHAPSGTYVRWRMDILFKRLRKGEVQRSIGVTFLRFDERGRVAYHQDYWDSGHNLFEKIPLLGSGIRAVKKRL